MRRQQQQIRPLNVKHSMQQIGSLKPITCVLQELLCSIGKRTSELNESVIILLFQNPHLSVIFDP